MPLYNPVLVAKEVASLDSLSRGRFMLGIGVGSVEPEFAAVGADFARRGAVIDEYVAAMRSLWSDEKPEYHGEFTDFVGVDAHPRPVQREIPIIVGGMMKPALRRSLKLGHGWFGCTSRRRSWPNAWNR